MTVSRARKGRQAAAHLFWHRRCCCCLDEIMDADKSDKPRSALRDLWQITSFLRPFKRHFAAALLIVVVMNVFLLARPFVIGKGFNVLGEVVLASRAVDKATEARQTAEQVVLEKAGAPADEQDIANKALVERRAAERDALAAVPSRQEAVASTILCVALYFVFGMIQAFLLRFREPIVMRLSVDLLRDLRTRIYAKIQQLSFNHLDRLTNGQIIERATGDVTEIRDFLTMSFIGAFDAVVVACLMIYFMWLLSPRFAAIVVAPFPLILYLFGKIASQIRTRRKAVRDEIDVMTSALTEGIAGVRVIRSFGKQEMMDSRYRAILRKIAGLAMRVHALREFGMLGIFNLTRLPEIGVIVYGGLVIMAGPAMGEKVEIGVLITFLMYVRMLLWRLHPLMEVGASAQGARAAYERITALMEVEDYVADAADAEDLPQGAGKVEFRNVNFAYQESPPPEADVVERMTIQPHPPTPAALEGINLTIEPGEVVALVGPTGAGKSTIVSLLPRFYDPTEGQILIDGRDFRSAAGRAEAQRCHGLPGDVSVSWHHRREHCLRPAGSQPRRGHRGGRNGPGPRVHSRVPVGLRQRDRRARRVALRR